MHNEFEHEDDDWRPEKSKFRKITEKTLTVAVLCFVFGIIIFMVIRLMTSYPPSSMKKMVWNESALAAYQNDPNGFSVSYYPSTDSFSDDSMFSISQITYIPSIGQYQATVRYNKRVLNYLCNDYGLTAVPDGETYIFMLRDNHGNVYKTYSYTAESRSNYEYRHVIFDGVDMDDVTKLVLEVYYIGDVQEASVRAELFMYRYDYLAQNYLYDLPAEQDTSVKAMPQYNDLTTTADTDRDAQNN